VATGLRVSAILLKVNIAPRRYGPHALARPAMEVAVSDRLGSVDDCRYCT
jgi:hypothetical protein